MIKSIELKNVQSHENSRLELDKGINVIIGSSNNGKSAILRGLFWARYNRPLGIDTLASHWALNDKGELKSPISVTIENESGKVERIRTRCDNRYIVNDKVLEVVKSDVPSEVEQLLCLSDTNIQRQLDEPFLLSKSSGEVAKYFNKVVRLDIIDLVLSRAESERRKTQADIKNAQAQIDDDEKKLEGFSWLESAERFLDKYERVLAQNKGLDGKVLFLSDSLNNYAYYLGNVRNLDNPKKLVEEILGLMTEITGLSASIERLSATLEEFEGAKDYPDFSAQKKLMNKIEGLNENGLELEESISGLEETLQEYEEAKDFIQEADERIEKYKKQLPKVCPICGNPI